MNRFYLALLFVNAAFAAENSQACLGSIKFLTTYTENDKPKTETFDPTPWSNDSQHDGIILEKKLFEKKNHKDVHAEIVFLDNGVERKKLRQSSKLVEWKQDKNFWHLKDINIKAAIAELDNQPDSYKIQIFDGDKLVCSEEIQIESAGD